MVELVLACLARNSSTYLLYVPSLYSCGRSTSRSPKRSPSSTASPKRSPLFPQERRSGSCLPSFPSYIVVNHILEYVFVIVSNVESFPHKAPVAFNCRLRFNGSINYFVCKTLSNLLSYCQMIETKFDNCVEPLHCVCRTKVL